METTMLDAIHKTIRVECSVEHAFKTFTDDMTSWWPLATHSVGRHEAESVAFEPGRLVERYSGGKEDVWGELLLWEPPRRLVLAWHPGRGPDEATELEVRFVPDGDGTLVELEHRGWDRIGARGPIGRPDYEKGWDDVLGCYAPAASA